jgi:hypothetical protein
LLQCKEERDETNRWSVNKWDYLNFNYRNGKERKFVALENTRGLAKNTNIATYI